MSDLQQGITSNNNIEVLFLNPMFDRFFTLMTMNYNFFRRVTVHSAGEIYDIFTSHLCLPYVFCRSPGHLGTQKSEDNQDGDDTFM